MHLFVVARGIADRINRWENDLLARYTDYIPEAGKIGPAGTLGKLQLGVRPIRLYEIAFPEGYLDNVLKLIRPDWDYGGKLDFCAMVLRKMLKLEKIPKYDANAPVGGTFFHRDHVAVTGIGIKRDNIIKGIEKI